MSAITGFEKEDEDDGALYAETAIGGDGRGGGTFREGQSQRPTMPFNRILYGGLYQTPFEGVNQTKKFHLRDIKWNQAVFTDPGGGGGSGPPGLGAHPPNTLPPPPRGGS